MWKILFLTKPETKKHKNNTTTTHVFYENSILPFPNQYIFYVVCFLSVRNSRTHIYIIIIILRVKNRETEIVIVNIDKGKIEYINTLFQEKPSLIHKLPKVKSLETSFLYFSPNISL
jgi:hypothetical protein